MAITDIGYVATFTFEGGSVISSHISIRKASTIKDIEAENAKNERVLKSYEEVPLFY